MARRRHQDGSLKADGDRWVVRWREDVILPPGSKVGKEDKLLPTGEVIHRKRVQDFLWKRDYPTKPLAKRALQDRLRSINSLDYHPQMQSTFADFAKRWMQTVMSQHQPSSQRREKTDITLHILPTFGSLSIRAITPELIQTWVSRQKYKPRSIVLHVATFKLMWKTAQDWGYADRDPFKGLRLPSIPRESDVYHFSLDETRRIIAAAEGRDKLLFRVEAETGMRPGELAGLKWSDIGPGKIHIKRSVGRKGFQQTKTSNAVRVFNISTSLERDLRAIMGNPDELVFSERGKPLDMDYYVKKVLRPILERLGIDTKGAKCGLYAFRHMNMTTMASNGVPLKTIQKRVGHSLGSGVTMTHYIHAVDADDERAADMLGMLLSQSTGSIQ